MAESGALLGVHPLVEPLEAVARHDPTRRGRLAEGGRHAPELVVTALRRPGPVQPVPTLCLEVFGGLVPVEFVAGPRRGRPFPVFVGRGHWGSFPGFRYSTRLPAPCE